MVQEPGWVRHAVWWHVYPLGFTGAERAATGQVTHRLGQVEAWLDYAVELGASGLLLGPVFASETHGYDTVDHFRIDPRLGVREDFDRLVEGAHRRGLRVLLDGVFNHVGRGFAAFAEGPSPEWFHVTGEGYEHFEGHAHLPTLNHGSGVVRDHVVEVMCHWLSAGVDGWRLDAAYAVPRGFWAEVLGRVRARFPEAYLVGEVIHGDYAAFVAETGVHSVTQYELWKAVWSSLNDRNLFELAWALGRHGEFLDSFVPLTFVGNHDVTRIASQVDPALVPHALVVLFTTGGTPAVYYGDEQGFRGVKEDREGGDDAVRPPFPAEGPSGLAPWGAPVLRLHQDLIGLRRRHPWLHRARTEAVELSNTGVVLVTEAEGQRLAAVLNIGDETARFRVHGDLLLGDAHVSGGAVQVGPRGWAVLG
ncbi:alpha-amylase family glycosyl hydrolase [Actinokineospora bangkokensis]|uniref:Alpha-amylase n=1 Tax=Actinokineospora bangkokensis TaxID=1193682 RepID=A0A1Q9LKB8_9PSEU|nr:alpha-amylase family glycosyl hydrolase [Actinokineospora bangkokensis]OLR92429.1 alpha-amylase [Actinokineospora bangkokensis]